VAHAFFAIAKAKLWWESCKNNLGKFQERAKI